MSTLLTQIDSMAYKGSTMEMEMTLDQAQEAYRANPSYQNAEALWSVANEYKDDGMLSEEGCFAIWEEVSGDLS